jgi:SPP1 gp7 family putative phage head morphogenesis protein
MQAKILDHRGNPIPLKKKSVYNLDPGFWGDRTGSTSFAINRVEKQPYKYHSTLFACVTAISEPLSCLPRYFYDAKKQEDYIEDHPALKVMRRPNPFMHGIDLWMATFMNLLLPTSRTPGGQVFWIGQTGTINKFTNWRKGEIPFEIYVYSDETISPIKDELGWITGWKMEVAGKRVATFSNDEVLRIHTHNPYDIAQGMSPYSAAQSNILQDTKAQEFNTKTFDNDGRVAGYLASEQQLTREQADEIMDAWMENYGGAGNADKVAILPFGLKYEQFAKSMRDMQFQQMGEANRKAIQSTYRVPDSEIAIYESGMNRATATQADRNFWQKNLIPKDKLVCSSINAQWIENIEGGKYRIESDKSEVEALQDDLDGKTQIAFRLWQMGVPSAKCLEMVDLDVDTKKMPWLKRSFISSGLTDAETMIGKEPSAPSPVGYSMKSMSQEDANKISIEYCAKVLDPGEKSFRRTLDSFFLDLRKEMLDNVDAWAGKAKDFEGVYRAISKETMSDLSEVRYIFGVCMAPPEKEDYLDILFPTVKHKGVYRWSKGCMVIGKAVGKVDPDIFLFDLKEANETLIKAYEPFVEDQMIRETNRLREELGSVIDWEVTPEDVEKFVKRRAKIIRKIDTTTFNAARDKIAEIVKEGIDQNMTVKELADAIKNGIKDTIEIRRGAAQTIARTETNAISADTRFEGFKEAGIENQRWITAHDERVRDSHVTQGMDKNAVVKVGERFEPTGLLFPMDPSTNDPSEVISCRCVAIPEK